MRKIILNSPRLKQLKKERHQKILNKFWIFISLTFILLIGIVFLSRINKLNIQDINISGNNIIETDAIKSIVEIELASKYVWLIPKTNIFLYPKNSIQNTLFNNFKRLKEINISLKENNTLNIDVEERKALYTWCGEEINIENTKCYFLNDLGYIFDEAPYFSGEVYFKFYGDINKNSDTAVGKYFNQTIFNKLISFKEVLEKIKIKPVSMYIMPKDDMKIYLSSSQTDINNMPYLILKKDSNFEKMSENLQAALDTDPFKTNFINNYNNLEYIDLRFGNKVYYKFR
jgi:cell division septal protein FtsQ